MAKNLTEGSPARVILMFTLPLIAGNVFQQMYSVVDTLLVGRFLGVESLAAVGCTGSLMFLVIGFINGSTTGLSIRTGQYFGAKDADGVRRSAATCAVVGLFFSLVISAGGLLTCRPLLIMMQTPPEILDDAVRFISIVYGGALMTVFFFLQTNIIRALGDSRTPTVMLALSLTVNIVLEPVVLLWLKWGVAGAALATVAAQAVGNAACLWFIWKKVPALHARGADWRVTGRDFYEHLKIGLPMGFQTAVVAVGAIIVQVALNQLGSLAVAAYAAAQKVDMIATMPILSFGMAMAAYTAQNYGARRLNRIREGVAKCVLMSGGLSIIAGVLNFTFGPSMMRLFVGDGEVQVIEYGQTFLMISSCFYVALALMFIFRFTLQGLGQSVVPTIAGIMELIMRIVAAVFLADWYGYIGVCLSAPLAWIASCVPMLIAWWHLRRTLVDKPLTGANLTGG